MTTPPDPARSVDDPVDDPVDDQRTDTSRRPAVDLRAEMRVLTRHLVRTEAPPEVVERYVAAHAQLLTTRPTPRDEAVARFLARYPVALGPLDAASGLLRPKGRLREKLLLATAVLEATTTFAPTFLARRTTMPRLVLSLAWLGFVGGCRTVLGIPLLLLVERSRP